MLGAGRIPACCGEITHADVDRDQRTGSHPRARRRRLLHEACAEHRILDGKRMVKGVADVFLGNAVLRADGYISTTT